MVIGTQYETFLAITCKKGNEEFEDPKNFVKAYESQCLLRGLVRRWRRRRRTTRTCMHCTVSGRKSTPSVFWRLGKLEQDFIDIPFVISLDRLYLLVSIKSIRVSISNFAKVLKSVRFSAQCYSWIANCTCLEVKLRHKISRSNQCSTTLWKKPQIIISRKGFS